MKTAKLIISIFASSISLAILAQQNSSFKSAREPAQDLPDNSAGAESVAPPADLGFGRGGYGAGLGGQGVSKTWMNTANRGAVGQVSVLCFKGPDQTELGETMEDIAVLGFLLSRNLEHAFAVDASDYKLGIPMLLTSGNQAVGASYIQGFGAILRLQVRFPLVSSADGPDETETAQTGSDWEQARRELMADDNPGTAFSSYEIASQPYDARLVQTLKKRVLVLLKNASNLRHLDGNEWIMVKILGSPTLQRVTRNARDVGEEPAAATEGELHARDTDLPLASRGQPSTGPGANRSSSKKSSRHAANNVRFTLASNQATVMALRVKKSAADAFAAGSLSEEQFIRSAEVAAYVNPTQPDADLKGANEGLKK